MSGKDIDCVVNRLDPLWPLRLRREWRLCQFSQYEVRGWFWVLEREGELVHLDTMDDRRGLGRDGFPTGDLDARGGDEASPAFRAVYLAMKRLRKGLRDEAEWARIRSLAAEDWMEFRLALEVLAGPRLGKYLDLFVNERGVADDRSWRAARWLQNARRFRTPSRLLMAGVLETRRVIGRMIHPTGWVVLIVGPDGSGKSTLAGSLVDGLTGIFRRDARLHWRPGLLPRPGALLGRNPPEPTRPHARPPHGRLLSLTLLGYYWLDFLAGWPRIWPLRLRTALVVKERGWWDLAADPRRFRLDIPPRLVRALGALLPHPDAVFVLHAPPRVILERKRELAEEDLRTQLVAWREVLPSRLQIIRLDASLPADELARTAREEALRMLERRAVSRLGAGWAQLGGGRVTRWWLPRGPRAAAAKGVSVYQPVTVRGRLGWEAARLAARLGMFRWLPREEAPPRVLREALGPHLPPRTTLAVARANHPGRYVAALVGTDGRNIGFAKVATDAAGSEALRREAEAIESFGPSLPPPLSAPRILATEPGLLLLEAVPWRPRLRPWRLEEDVAWALGAFFRDNARGNGGPAHGDCAPWNLLETTEGWVIVDWEAALPEAPPFYDLCHYLIQGHTLLGRPSWNDLLQGFDAGTGWVGRAVRAYAEGAGVPAGLGFLEAYLRTSRSIQETLGDRVASRARSRLLQDLAR